MTELDESEIRRRKIVFRAWHRGTREMDLLLGRFADRHVASLDASELNAFEQLMELPDPDVYNWIVGTVATPADYDTPLLHSIRAFHLGEGGAE